MQISTLFLKKTQGKYFIFKGKPGLARGPLCEATCAFPQVPGGKVWGLQKEFHIYILSHLPLYIRQNTTIMGFVTAFKSGPQLCFCPSWF